MFEFSGKTVLITGAAGGIGGAAAKAFHAAGANLILSDLIPEKIMTGENILAVYCDVTDRASVKTMVQNGIGKFGVLDIAINNAGIASKKGQFVDMDDALWHKLIDVNLTGMYYALRAELDVMIPQNRGRIINVASIAGVVGSPYLAAYSATKHAVVGLTKSLVDEVARHHIALNALCPSYINTPMLDDISSKAVKTDLKGDLKTSGRFGTVEEMADALLWLASPRNSFMNGQAIVLDGGLCAA